MADIKYSPANPGDWENLTFDTNHRGGIERWVEEKYTLANKKVLEGILPSFNAIVFSKANLKAILSQDPLVIPGEQIPSPCTKIAFSHIMVLDNNSSAHSCLLAIGETDNGQKFAKSNSPLFVGTPMQIKFGEELMRNHTLHYGHYVEGFKWKIADPGDKKLTDWLTGLTLQKSFLRNVDMLIRVRLNLDDKNIIFNEVTGPPKEEDKDNLIAFFPVICACEIDLPNDPDADVSGNYCTLIACELTKDGALKPNTKTNFLVASDSWRPNWPVGGKQSLLLKKFGELFEKLDELRPCLK